MSDVQRTTEPSFNELLATGPTPTQRTDVAATLPTRVEEFRRVLSSLDDALQYLSRVVATASPGVTDYYSEALDMLDARLVVLLNDLRGARAISVELAHLTGDWMHTWWLRMP